MAPGSGHRGGLRGGLSYLGQPAGTPFQGDVEGDADDFCARPKVDHRDLFFNGRMGRRRRGLGGLDLLREELMEGQVEGPQGGSA